MRLNVRFLFFSMILILSIAVTTEVVSGDTPPENAILSAESAIIDVTMSGSVELIPTGDTYSISEVKIESLLYPRDAYHQDLSDFRTEPRQYTTEDDAIVMEWDDPSGDIDYSIGAVVETDGSQARIRRKIGFPHDASGFSNDVSHYLQSAELIDSDHPEVIAKAEELTDGIDDYYEAVFEIAKWVNMNVDYNLSTLNEEAERSASWVLDNERGVCAEMTSLFIAMLRAIDIPARYVSGLSYTDSDLFDFNWGAHAWADVYFPEHGWVPFDVTYGEYGFIDSSHIKFRDTLDSGEASSYYQWYGNNVDLRSRDMVFDAEIIEMTEREMDDIEIDITTRSEEVSFGSYNLIIATVSNKKNYYLPITMSMSQTENLELLDEQRQEVLLRPGEERKMYWRIRVDGDLSSNHIYTFPFRLSSPGGYSAQGTFTARASGMEFSRDDIDRALESRLERGDVPYSNNVDFVCEFSKRKYYPQDDIVLGCDVDNKGDLDLDDLELCIYDDDEEYCKTRDLLGRQDTKFEFEIEDRDIGRRPIDLELTNDDVSISDSMDLIVRDYPSLEVLDLEVPEAVDYGDEFNLSFMLVGKYDPINVDVRLSMMDLERRWDFDKISTDREFVISMVSRDLVPGNNTISIDIDYEDDEGRSYELKEDVNVRLENVPVLDNLFMRIRRWLENLIRR